MPIADVWAEGRACYSSILHRRIAIRRLDTNRIRTAFHVGRRPSGRSIWHVYPTRTPVCLVPDCDFLLGLVLYVQPMDLQEQAENTSR